MNLKTESKTPEKLTLSGTMWTFYIAGVFLALFGLVLMIIFLSADAGEKLLFLVLGLALLGGGALSFVFGGTKRIILDKTTGEIIMQKKRIITSNERKYALANALKITQQVTTHSGSRRRDGRAGTPRTIYNYTLQFNDGSNMLLGSVTRTMGVGRLVGGGQSSIPSYVHEIMEFLNIPLEEDSLGKTAATASTIGSITDRFVNRG